MRKFRKAILIIHGFTGSLYDNEYLMNHLEYNNNFDVYAWTLPGHDRDRFSHVKEYEWIDFVNAKTQELINLGYHTIYIIGHSMGGVLASHVASKYKEVKKLVLINASFDYLNIKQNKIDIIKNRDFSSYKHIMEKFLRTSVFSVVEFTKLVKKYQFDIRNVTCETLILRSLKDEIIPYETADKIYKEINCKKKYLTNLKDCTHIALKGNRKDDISEYINKFLKGGLKWKHTMTTEL